MPNLLKERLVYVLNRDNNNYLEMVNFFLDPDISLFDKEKKSTQFLKNEFELLNDANTDIDFPQSLSEIKQWTANKQQHIYSEYKAYLNRRQNGQHREYFNSVSHVFEFLIKIAPVKKVDGAWLYSLTNYWSDADFRELISIYLEELGQGLARANHVKLYNDLLQSLGLEHFEGFLEDRYYHQPATQLALSYASPEFIPEIVGFNLGYEQLPLHLLITNYELKELGIDSHYFNVHITIDNHDSGHAAQSIQAVEKIAQKYKNKDEFYHKLRRGYALNDRGVSSTQIVKDLNLNEMIINIFKRKALVGRYVHNDKCKFMEKTINQWLNDPEQISNFLDILKDKNWIKTGEDPELSRFWTMINDVDGKMYGVFNSAEKQMIYDWIANATYAEYSKEKKNISITHPELHDYSFAYLGDEQLKELKRKIELESNIASKVNTLIPYLAPHLHHTEVGLWSTYQYVRYLFPQLIMKAHI